ncbi:helix-turn-helix domain-containing protein [Bacillus thuringiensis]
MLIYQRQQHIITILLQNQKWYTLEEIAELAQCSTKTVQRDLHYLKEQLPSDWVIQITKGQGVILYKPPHSSQTSMYSFFKQEDMRSLVLQQLFQGHVQTITQLADALYVRVPVLSPVLRSVQSYLQYFHLELHKRPLRIVGKESHIVYMFYELYFTTYRWEEWPFPEEADVFSYIAQIEQKLDIQFYPNYKQRLAYLLAIAIRRKKQGHEITFLPIYERLIMDTPFYLKIIELPTVLCDVPLTKTDQIFITIAVNCCMYVYSNRNQHKQEMLQYFFEGTSTVYRYAQVLVAQLESIFHIPFHQDEEFLFCLLQYIRQISYRYQFIPNLTSPAAVWHEQIKQKHAITFRKVSSVYTTWIKEHPFLNCANEEDILAITLQLEAAFQLSRNYRKKVLLYLEDSILWRRYIQGVLYSEFGNNLSIVSEEVLDIHTCDLQQLGIDGILSTLPLETLNLPVIQISVVPTQRELDDIRAFLNEAYGVD